MVNPAPPTAQPAGQPAGQPAAQPAAQPAGQPAGQPATAAPEPLGYAYSTGNAFAAFMKFNGKNYFMWRCNMETQLKALGQWEVIDGTVTAPTIATPNAPTPDETRATAAW